MGSSKKITVSHWYKLIAHLGWCKGPIDALLEIRGGDRVAWSGRQTTSGLINVNRPNLYGGESAEGGIDGQFEVMMGEPDQAPNGYLASTFGPAQPGYRGRATILLRGPKIGAGNPYPKTLYFKLERVLKGWDDDVCWYPEKAPIIGSLPTIGTNVWTHLRMVVDGANVYGFINGRLVVQGVLDFTPDGGDGGYTTVGRYRHTSSGDNYEGYIDNVTVTKAVRSTEDFVPQREAFTEENDPYWSQVLMSLRGEGPDGSVTFADDKGNPWTPVSAGITISDEQAIDGGSSIKVQGDGAITTPYTPSLNVGSHFTVDAWVRPSDLAGYVVCVNQLDSDHAGYWMRLRPDGRLDVVVGRNTWPSVPAAFTSGAPTDTTPRWMNPAHILYDSITSRRENGGMEEPIARINDASFRAAADRFWAEGFGLCCTWHGGESAEQFQQRICNVAGASLSQSRKDGQYYLDLLREVEDPSSLPTITDDDIRDWQAEPALPPESINQIQVKWFDPETREERITTPVQSLGAIEDAGGVIADIRQYYEIPSESIALRVAQRDLQSSATALWKFTITCTRRPYDLRPGMQARLLCPKRGFADVIVVIGDIDYGDFGNDEINIVALQDVFSLPDSAFVEPQEGLGEPTSQTPTNIVASVVEEAPYVELAAAMNTADLQALDNEVGFLLVGARRPANGNNYRLATKAAGEEYEEYGNVDWTPSAYVVEGDTLPNAAPQTAFTLSQGQFLDRVVVGSWAQWGSEICRVDAIDPDAGTVLLGRACGDTVPQEHAPLEMIYFLGDWNGSDAREYADGETVFVKMLNRTSQGQIDLNAAPEQSVLMASRQFRPYPPAKARLNGEHRPEAITGDLEITWVDRDRLVQADQLIDSEQDGVGPEAGTTYTVRNTDATTLTETYVATGLSSAPHTVPGASLAPENRLELFSVRDGVESWQRVIFEFTAGSAPPAPDMTYASLNPLDSSSNLVLTNGRKTATRLSGSAWAVARSTVGKAAGKWYIEVTNNANGSTTGDALWGFADDAAALTTYPGNASLGADSMGWEPNTTPDSTKFQNGSLGAVAGYGTVSAGQWSGFAIDFDAGKLWVKNSSGSGWAGGGNPETGASPTFTFTANTHLHFVVAAYSGPQQATVNFGASAFNGAVPSGFGSGWFAPKQPFSALPASTEFSMGSSNDSQGVATDGTHVWLSSSSTIYKYDAAGTLVTSRSVMGDDPTSKTQINGMFVKDGVLYVSAAENSTPRKSWIVEYDPDTLAYIAHHEIAGDWFSEGLAWKDGYWWVVFHANKVVAKVNSSWAVVATFPLTFLVTGSSGGYGSGTGYDGVAWWGNYLVCNIHEIYDQDFLDIYHYSGASFVEVARLHRPTTKATQGLAIDPTDPTVMWAVERASSGSDSVAKVTLADADPHKEYVVSLLRCNGANGGTTFTDLTGRPWTGTNATTDTTVELIQGAAGRLLGPASPGSVATSKNGLAVGSGPWCVEMTIRPAALPSSGRVAALLSTGRQAGPDYYGIRWFYEPDGKLRCYLSTNGTGISVDLQSAAGLIAVNTTARVCLERQGDTVRMMHEGVVVASAAISGSVYLPTADNATIGAAVDRSPNAPDQARMNGRFDEFRWTIGVHRYGGAYTPLDGPFPY